MIPLSTSWRAESHGAVGFFITARENTVIHVQTSIFWFQKCPKSGIELGVQWRHTLESCLVDLTFFIVYVIVFSFLIVYDSKFEVDKICVILSFLH